MGKIICLVTEDFADFEITLVFHKIKNIGKRQVLSAGYTYDAVMSESGLHYKPDLTVSEATQLDDIEGLIIPGGPIREQRSELTEFIIQLNQQKKLIAAICNGPQYLGRAGILNNHTFTTSCSIEAIHKLGTYDPFPRENYIDQRVVKDGNIITAKGRAFVDFSFAVFEYLDIYQGQYEEQEQLFKDIMNK
ncbi:Putative intracellular protease/amidase [Paenibacillus sp. 1_12]|uniref:DJ-1/PfpI family protein n=1 Tax=Paenibacillus sp. 1_12 TaxID=1566278 RepID=UPI0008EBDF54|nr:DJ-1/PfpI family protein [Paenibacillus sp. 1_12]SFL34704.1 Putative intracellular protease/amidase [Paenibacillus sp. 1_12]